MLGVRQRTIRATVLKDGEDVTESRIVSRQLPRIDVALFVGGAVAETEVHVLRAPGFLMPLDQGQALGLETHVPMRNKTPFEQIPLGARPYFVAPFFVVEGVMQEFSGREHVGDEERFLFCATDDACDQANRDRSRDLVHDAPFWFEH